MKEGKIIKGKKENYKIIKLLGFGGNSKIHLIERQIDRKLFVLKENDDDEYKILQILNGVNCHPLVICAEDKSKDNEYIILEYIKGYTINDLIYCVEELKLSLPEKIILKFARYIFEGLKFIHNKKITHGDLHGDNIMFMNLPEPKIKIIDFGQSINFSRDFDVREMNKMIEDDLYWAGILLLRLLAIKLDIQPIIDKKIPWSELKIKLQKNKNKALIQHISNFFEQN
jgi:serine/threonine protein kinase